MKRVSFWKTVAPLLGLCLLTMTACGGGDDDTPVDACAALPAAAPASGASAPVSTTGAYLCGAGVGVADLEKAVTFYKALGMTERARITRNDRQEVVLDSADQRGSRLMLFTYTDGSSRNYRQNPGKIVFYVKTPSTFAAAFHAAASAAGSGGITATPTPIAPGSTTVVGFGRDPNNNLVEIASLAPTDPAAAQTHSYISAFGIGVSNLTAARDFYVNTLDMRVSQFLSVNKAPSTPWYDEYILASNAGRGSAIVLMTYTDGIPKNYNNNPVRLTLRTNDPAAYAQRITAANVAGATVVRAPGPVAELGGAVTGQATDANGTQLEILPN
ncbi:MAG TPA: VOC family protein [Rhizobacter sp.]|nr:VOC family protein [Rhizobacter sp.]